MENFELRIANFLLVNPEEERKGVVSNCEFRLHLLAFAVLPMRVKMENFELRIANFLLVNPKEERKGVVSNCEFRLSLICFCCPAYAGEDRQEFS